MAFQVGVFGASGYSGQEAVRLLGRHPHAQVGFATGSASGLLDHDAGLERAADAYLLALPHGVAARFAQKLRSRFPQAPVVDLSGDLRLASAEEYERWYGQPHEAPELLGTAPYGLTEVHREAIRAARLVSNPGCYATSVLLPLVPLVREGLLALQGIVVDAKSGATGAGRSPKPHLLFCEVAENLSAYSPGRTHRHVAEIEKELSGQCGRELSLTFCPHLLPLRRGILSAIYVEAADVDALHGCLARFYAGAPFVRVLEPGSAPPQLAEVAWTNDCRISVHATAPGRAVLFSAIDNLLKGAAGQAIQNLNLICGWPETAGLPGGRA